MENERYGIMPNGEPLLNKGKKIEQEISFQTSLYKSKYNPNYVDDNENWVKCYDEGFAEGKKQGVIETCDKILLDLTIADIGTPPKISNVDDRIKIRQYLSNLKLHAEQSLGEK